MSINKAILRQRDFTAGELDDNAERRSDLDIHGKGLRRALNVRARDTGALTRRPGRRALYFDTGVHELIRPISTQVFDITFAEERFTVRLQGGGVVANITGCPWTAALLPLISWQVVGLQIFVCARGMQTHYIEFDPDAGTWSLFAYEFDEGSGGRVKAPFYRFAAGGITLTPSALTGSITLTASADVFNADHVGVMFTYAGKMVEITAYTSPTEVTATVLEALPPTWRVTVDTTDGFAVGQSVEGSVSNTVGEVVAVPSSTTVDILVYNNFSGFQADEYVVGTNGRGKVTSQTKTSIPLGAAINWEEQFMSEYRGWPGSVAFDSERLIFCDFAQLEDAILESAIGNPFDFDAAEGSPTSAIFTRVPTPCRVLQVIGGQDQFILTDRGIFFIPVSESAPLQPGNDRFKRIAATAAANVRAVLAGDAVIFVGSEVNRLFAILPTGDNTAPYQIRPLTDFHQHLFPDPIAIAVSEGSTEAPGRHLYVVNSDGTLVVGRYTEGADFMGWFPWESTGLVTDVAAAFGSVILTVEYQAANVVEAVDDSKMLDGVVSLADFVGNDEIDTSTGAPIQTSTGASIVTENGALIPFAGVTMYGWADGFFLGEIDIDAEGRVDFPTGYTDREVGWLFTPEVQPWIPTFEGGQDYGQATRKRKVAKVLIAYRDSQTFLADGREYAGYQVGDDMGEPRPLRDGAAKYRQLGRSYDPVVDISQPTPGALTIVEITTEVTV